jgi:hypothetical protein
LCLSGALNIRAPGVKLKINLEVSGTFKTLLTMAFRFLATFALYGEVGEFPIGGLWGVCVETALTITSEAFEGNKNNAP